MDNKNIPELIKEILKTNPRGMTVAEVAKKIGMNSQSTGRHLDVLAAAGHVDVRTFGRSKVYYISQRLPILAMMNLSPNMMLVLDKELKIANMNQKFLDFTNIKRGDLLNKCIEDISFPLAFKPDITSFAMHALSGKLSIIEAHYQRENDRLEFTIKFIPMIFDNGEKGVTLIFEDITERKMIEEERSFLAAIVESSEDAIIGKTLDGIVTSWNKSAERIYGYTAGEMIGQNVSILVPPDRPNEIPDILRRIKRGEKVKHYETERVRKDGKRFTVSLTVSPIFDSNGNILGASTIAFEVVERKKAKRAVKSSYDNLKMLFHTLFWPAIIYASATLCF
jgi:PAS domain S-box-containing protein